MLQDEGHWSGALHIGDETYKRQRKRKAMVGSKTIYIDVMLKKFNMDQCNAISTPMDINQKITKDMCPKSEEEITEMANVPYQEAIGSIIYAAQVTRPDISYALGVLSDLIKIRGKHIGKPSKEFFVT